MTAQVQDAGLARITVALTALPWFIGWGQSTGALAAADDLANPAPEARVAATATQGTTTVADDTLQLAATITALAPRMITEIGAFDAAGTGSPPSGGLLAILCEVPSVSIGADDSIAVTMSLIFR